MVLKELADLLMETLRVNDLVARWGGEEFICCLPNTNRDQVVIVAEKIRKQVEDHIFEEVGHITISIGGTLVTPEDNKLDGPIGRADNGLYESKNNGRNRSTIV
jgi:diguanylate cyclase (GGDEF)-like protein